MAFGNFNFMIVNAKEKMAMLKAYSQISNRGRSQKIQHLNFLHIFVTFLQKIHFPKEIKHKSFPYKIAVILGINSRVRELI